MGLIIGRCAGARGESDASTLSGNFPRDVWHAPNYFEANKAEEGDREIEKMLGFTIHSSALNRRDLTLSV